jgi:hypothetical protein
MTNPLAPIASAVENMAYLIHRDVCRNNDYCGRFPEHTEAARRQLGITSTKIEDWPVTIVGAPLRCGRCQDPIHSAGTGPLCELEAALRDHLAQCDALTERGVIHAPK